MATRVIDVITYNGESELFDLRYNILKDYVDEFIVVEFDKTFSGKEKPQYFTKELHEKYGKVRYVWLHESAYEKYRELAENSPNTIGADHWKREFMQKESIKDCLTHLNDEDIVFIGDCDEIWDPTILFMSKGYGKIKLRVYTYYLNNRSSEEFWGTLYSPYKLVKDKCLNHLRSDTLLNDPWKLEFGWHFTSMGGPPAVRKKLTDSYTKESYATDYVLEKLEENIEGRKDFLGRNFTYKIDESEWPQYLKDNKHKYKHLIYEPS